MISFRVYNRRTVVLNSRKAVHDLLDRRAALYSDRPKTLMYNVLCGRGQSVFNVSSLGQRHQTYRKLLQSGLGQQATLQYWPVLEQELYTLLDGLAESPKDYEWHFRRYLKLVYLLNI